LRPVRDPSLVALNAGNAAMSGTIGYYFGYTCGDSQQAART